MQKNNKALKPSQREAITPFSSEYGNGMSFEDKLKIKKAIRIFLIVICIAALISIGYFFTDLFIGFSKIPADAYISPEGASKWISFRIIQG